MPFVTPEVLRWMFPMSLTRRIAAQQREIAYHLFWPWVRK